MKHLNFIVCILMVVIFIGCGEKPIYSKKINTEGSWTYANELSYPIAITDINLNYDLILSLTYGIDFSYQNLYVKIFTHYPSGKIDEDILSLNLTDGNGLFLGNCNSSKCTVDLLLQENFKFNEAGDYTIKISQNGREDKLENIYGLALKLFEAKRLEG